MPTVTAIIPTYNRSRTLHRALSSIYAQTRTPDEVIVIDDASSDDTAEIVSKFPVTHYIKKATNAGAAAARNSGLEKATSDYIAFLDSDDIWHPEKIETQLEYMHANQNTDLLCTGITVHKSDGQMANFGINKSLEVGQWTFEDFLSYPFSPTTWLIRKSALLSAGLFDSGLNNCEDLDLLAKLNVFAKIALIDDALAVKFNQPDSLDANISKRAVSIDILFERHAPTWAMGPDAAVHTCLTLASQHYKAGDSAKGRKALIRGWHFKPYSPRLCLRLLLAFLTGSRYSTVQRLLRPRN